MIQQSFLFLPGIKERMEKRLWQQGVCCWDDFLERKKIAGLSTTRKERYDCLLQEAKERYFAEDSSYFSSCFPLKEHWRLYDAFKDDAIYLDIEPGRKNQVALVGLCNGYDTAVLVKGHNLDEARLKQVLSKAKLLVTFNGNTFDLPVLERHFRLDLKIPRIDVRHLCSRLGLKGGLKDIEENLDLPRKKEIRFRGPEPSQLWRCWMATGNPHFLELLIQYNEEDVINLRFLAERVIAEMKEITLESPLISSPK